MLKIETTETYHRKNDAKNRNTQAKNRLDPPPPTRSNLCMYAV